MIEAMENYVYYSPGVVYNEAYEESQSKAEYHQEEEPDKSCENSKDYVKDLEASVVMLLMMMFHIDLEFY